MKKKKAGHPANMAKKKGNAGNGAPLFYAKSPVFSAL